MTVEDQPHGVGSLIVRLNREFTNKYNHVFIDESTGDVVVNAIDQAGVGYQAFPGHQFARSVDISGFDATPRGLFVRNGEPTAYLVGADGDDIIQLDLGNVDTLAGGVTQAGVKDISGQTLGPSGITFKPDGTKLFLGTFDGTIEVYDLSTAWDIQSATAATEVDLSTDLNQIGGVDVAPDGTRIFVTTRPSDEIFQYDMSIAWDETTITAGSQDETVALGGGGVGDPNSLEFSPDGSYVHIGDDNNGDIWQFYVPVPFDVTSISEGQFRVLNHGLEDISPHGVSMVRGGSRLFVVGQDADNLYEWYGVGGDLISQTGYSYGDRLVLKEQRGIGTFSTTSGTFTGPSGSSGKGLTDYSNVPTDVVLFARLVIHTGGTMDGDAEFEMRITNENSANQSDGTFTVAAGNTFTKVAGPSFIISQRDTAELGLLIRSIDGTSTVSAFNWTWKFEVEL